MNAESIPPTTTYRDFLDGNHIPIEMRVVGDEEEAEGDPDLLAQDSMTAKVQFRQLSVSDGISCGISLIGSHIRCWGTLLDSKAKKWKQNSDIAGAALPR